MGGNAMASCLFLLTVVLPAAIRPPGPVTSDSRLQAISVVLFLCLPITVLAMSLGRLSASTRDRRLAALRLLGLSPSRTRLVAGLENGVLAGAGVLLGMAGALRHEGATARPSLWRPLPLTVGVAFLVATILWIRPNPDLTGAVVMLTGAALTGVGLVVALPVAVGAVADLLSRRPGGTTIRLAARRLQTESSSTIRMVAGLTIAAFVITGALGVLTAFKATPQYQAQRHALVHGPQLDRIYLPDPPSLAPDVHPAQVRRQLLATPGVQAVIPDHGIRASPSTCKESDFCGEVFVGTCQQLELLQVVPGAATTRSPSWPPRSTPTAPGRSTRSP